MKEKIYELYALEQLATGNTFVHRLHPVAKLLASVVFIVTVVSFDRYALGRLVPYIFYTMILTALSETPYSMLLKRFLIALPFCLFAGISNVIFDRTAAFTFAGITISGGVVSLVVILFKAYLCVMAVLLLMSVTPLSGITGAMRRLRVPGIFITMFEMTYRYIGVLLSEAYSMHIAYVLRSSAGNRIKMKDMGSFAGQLIIRSFDRADRVYNAMKCRGYGEDLSQRRRGAKEEMNKSDSKLCVLASLRDAFFFIIVTLFCVTFRFVDVNATLAGFFGRLL